MGHIVTRSNRFFASLGRWLRLTNGTTAVLENEGACAIFGGRRYSLIPDYRFQIAPKFRSLERKARRGRVIPGDLENEVEGIATLGNSPIQIRIMGEQRAWFRRNVEVLVFFTTPYEEYQHTEEWPTTEEEARRGWPCQLGYEADERTGILKRWHLVLDVPAPDIEKIADLAVQRGVHKMYLNVILRGLYVPEKQVSDSGFPRGHLAYLLPKSHWGGKTPKVYGYVSSLEVDQQLFAEAAPQMWVMWRRRLVSMIVTAGVLGFATLKICNEAGIPRSEALDIAMLVTIGVWLL